MMPYDFLRANKLHSLELRFNAIATCDDRKYITCQFHISESPIGTYLHLLYRYIEPVTLQVPSFVQGTLTHLRCVELQCVYLFRHLLL